MKYLTWVIIALWFFLGVYIFLAPSFDYLPKMARVIFGVFCILFGFYRLARLYAKNRNSEEE
ncbi:MAG: hypothetical protein AUJ97_04940 [Bacteroidetes bacterium CG2_30_32_10]|nr:MAG: hypothetical protein AUJ97_04940 [Bacteroidetes bacterium CG2_30_32_10]